MSGITLGCLEIFLSGITRDNLSLIYLDGVLEHTRNSTKLLHEIAGIIKHKTVALASFLYRN